MIAYIYGNVVALDERRAIIHASGPGYEVVLGPSCHGPRLKVHNPTELYTVHHITEKAQVLFGFPTLAERDTAADIIAEVDGVGPVMAHRFVTTAGYDAIAKAVMGGDTGGVPKVKGISSNKVTEIITALRKIGKVTSSVDPRVPKVVGALRAIGHTAPDLEGIVAEVARRNPELDTGEIVKKVIPQLGKT